MVIGIDWRRVTDAAVAHVVTAVGRVRAEHPDDRLYGAIFHLFYGDGTVIYWPSVAVGTEESLAEVAAEYRAQDMTEADLRWSGADLRYRFDAGEVEAELAARCQDAVVSEDFAQWERVYDRFLLCFPDAAVRAQTELIDTGVVDEDFIVIASDQDERLVPLSLSPSQLRRFFPEFDC